MTGGRIAFQGELGANSHEACVAAFPDMTPVHDAMMAQLQDTMNNGVSPDIMMSMLKSWSPMGDTGMKLWQGLLDQVTSVAKK